MDENKEKIIITDLTAIKKSEEEEIYRGAAEGLLKLIEYGKTPDEILQIIFKSETVVSMKDIEIMREIVETAFRIANKKKGNEFHAALTELLAIIDEKQKFLYKGKDGKDYINSSTVDIMDEDYKNQLYTENQSKHM